MRVEHNNHIRCTCALKHFQLTLGLLILADPAGINPNHRLHCRCMKRANDAPFAFIQDSFGNSLLRHMKLMNDRWNHVSRCGRREPKKSVSPREGAWTGLEQAMVKCIYLVHTISVSSLVLLQSSFGIAYLRIAIRSRLNGRLSDIVCASSHMSSL